VNRVAFACGGRWWRATFSPPPPPAAPPSHHFWQLIGLHGLMVRPWHVLSFADSVRKHRVDPRRRQAFQRDLNLLTKVWREGFRGAEDGCVASCAMHAAPASAPHRTPQTAPAARRRVPGAAAVGSGGSGV